MTPGMTIFFCWEGALRAEVAVLEGLVGVSVAVVVAPLLSVDPLILLGVEGELGASVSRCKVSSLWPAATASAIRPGGASALGVVDDGSVDGARLGSAARRSA